MGFGIQRDREVIKEKSGGRISAFQSFTSFQSLDEVQIMMCYGAKLEHMLKEEKYKFLESQKHQIAFVKMDEKTVVGILRLNTQSLPNTVDESLTIREGGFVTLEWQPMLIGQDKTSKCIAVVVPDIAGIAGSNLLLWIIGKPARYFASQCNWLKEQRRYQNVSIRIHSNDASVKRQIDMIIKLCGNECDPLWQKMLLLNMCRPPISSPFDPLSLTDSEIDQAYAMVDSAFNNNASQEEILKAIFRVHGNILYVKGYPGSGKSTNWQD